MRKEVISFEDPTDENWKSTEIKTNKKKKKKTAIKSVIKENSLLLKDFILKKH